MRLFEIENINDINVLVEFIRKNCSKYLSTYPDCVKNPMIRGISKGISAPTILPVNKNRAPVATPLQIHNLFVNAFKKAGFQANRDNSIFCTGNIEQAEMYASGDGLIAVFPIGDFHITWSDKVSDLYMDLEWLFEEHIIGFDENKKFSDDFVEDRLYDIFKALKDKNGLQLFSKVATSRPISLKDTFDCSIDPEEAKKFFYTTVCKEIIIEKLAKLNVDVVDISLVDFLKNNYQSTNISDAISSGFEIMVESDSYVAIPLRILKTLEGKL